MNPFSLPFMQFAVAASLMAGLALAWVGLFVLVRGVSFSGLAVSQLAALGTVAGVLLGLHYGEFGIALALVGAGMAVMARFSKISKVPQESWVACLYILGAGLAVMALSKAPQGESHTLGVFFGNVLSLGPWEVWESLGILLLSNLTLAFWLHRWIWLAFDPLSAQVSGIQVDRWNLLFFSVFAVTMTVSIHIFGVLLAFAYLLLPAITGLLVVRKLEGLLFFIPALTVLATLIGFYLSFVLDFPAGPFIASLLAGIALIAGAFRSFRPR